MFSASMPMKLVLPLVTPCQFPRPAWLARPAATMKKVPSRPRQSCDSGPGRSGRPLVTTARLGMIPVLDPAV